MNTHLKQLWAAMKLPKNFKKSYKFFCRGLDIRVTTRFDNILKYHNKLFYKNVSRCIDIVNTIKYSLQGTTQSRYLTGGVPPVRFSM